MKFITGVLFILEVYVLFVVMATRSKWLEYDVEENFVFFFLLKSQLFGDVN